MAVATNRVDGDGITVSSENSLPGVERRTFRAECRAVQQDGPRTISGYAARFNSPSEDLGGFRETVTPGAFDACLKDDVRALVNHDPGQVLGRTSAGTLTIEQDDNGLRFDVTLPDTTAARDLAASMDRGDIDQCSFSFTVASDGATWDKPDKSGLPMRHVNKVSRLYDVSVVTYPAYPSAACQIRSNAEILSEIPAPEGQTVPPASSGGVAVDLLRRRLDLSLRSIQ